MCDVRRNQTHHIQSYAGSGDVFKYRLSHGAYGTKPHRDVRPGNANRSLPNSAAFLAAGSWPRVGQARDASNTPWS